MRNCFERFPEKRGDHSRGRSGGGRGGGLERGGLFSIIPDEASVLGFGEVEFVRFWLLCVVFIFLLFFFRVHKDRIERSFKIHFQGNYFDRGKGKTGEIIR